MRSAGDRLLEWFDVGRRSLPWRGDRDPYRVLVSEIMLQQTTVEAVLARYEEFVRTFPTIQDLARAESESVKSAWSGLGYYRRAERLHASARKIVSEGAFPQGATAWRLLPGVGEYTAAALASIVQGEVVAALDGNVERVMARHTAEEGNPKGAAAKRRLRAAATELLDLERPGDSNQAMMDLGALVCRPREPRCSLCPISPECAAHQLRQEHRFPRQAPRATRQRWYWYQVLVERPGDRSGEVLLTQRSLAESILPGRWELPGFISATALDSAAAAARLLTVLGLARVSPPNPSTGSSISAVGSFRHAITNRDFEVVLSSAVLESAEVVDQGNTARWVARQALEHPRQLSPPLPTSSMLAKALRLSRAKRAAQGDR